MSMSSPSNGIGSICQMRSQLTSQPSSAAMRSLASLAVASMSASTSASRARWSSDSSQMPLNAVTMPGLTFTIPVVARTSSRLAASSRKASALRAAARKASRRTSIGVEPAWACRPVKRTAWRSTPKVPSTAPSGLSIDSSTGPCSMCSSR